MNIEDVLAEIEKIYDELPTVHCQGLCWNSCGPISISSAERERIRQRGVEIPGFSEERAELWRRNVVAITDRETGAQLRLDCPALTPMKRCAVYDIRPFICRAFGAGRGDLACVYGCKVEGRRLRAEEILEMQTRIMAVSGDLSEEEMGLFTAVQADPEIQQLSRRFFSGDMSARRDLIAAISRRTNEIRRGRGDLPQLRDE